LESDMIVEGRMIGKSRPLFPDWSVPLPPEWTQSDAGVPLKDLIVSIVLAEVDAFRARREERRLTRVLTASQIAEGAARGKVDSGGREVDEPGVDDPQQAVGVALQAFDDGLYYVFVDDEHRQNLSDIVPVKPGTRVTFLRLVALAGG